MNSWAHGNDPDALVCRGDASGPLANSASNAMASKHPGRLMFTSNAKAEGAWMGQGAHTVATHTDTSSLTCGC